MKEISGFRDWLAESERLRYAMRRGSLRARDFVWQAYELLAEAEKSADSRVRIHLVQFLEGEIRYALKDAGS